MAHRLGSGKPSLADFRPVPQNDRRTPNGFAQAIGRPNLGLGRSRAAFDPCSALGRDRSVTVRRCAVIHLSMLPNRTPLPFSHTVFLIGFWAIVFLINLGPDWHRYGSVREMIEVVGVITVLQWLIAWAANGYLVPHWLDRGKVFGFAILALIVLLIGAELNILLSYFYLEEAYPETYGAYYQRVLADMSLSQRMGLSYLLKFIVLSKLPQLAFPAAALIAVNYYQRQQQSLELREQKRAAELNALKNQLNPHFIFNTLNNIYALAIKRSELTAEAIAKLSGILDYVLYRSNGVSVSLAQEAAMIEDYVALERLRFGDRVEVSFLQEIQEPCDVAPLLLLTLVENAFKHGASQALDSARIEIHLSADDEHVLFEIFNTKPPALGSKDDAGPMYQAQDATIGLANLRRQLSLLYPGRHRLEIEDTRNHFLARLSIAGEAR